MAGEAAGGRRINCTTERGEVMKFHKKPVVIEATQYAPNMAQLPPGVWEEWSMPDNSGHCTAYIRRYSRGRMTVSPGDWVITDAFGEHFLCPSDIFTLEYEPSREVTGSPGAPVNAAQDALDAAEQQGYERGLKDAPGSKLIDAWAALRGPISWAKAVEITAITQHMPDDERQRLLALDDAQEPPVAGVRAALHEHEWVLAAGGSICYHCGQMWLANTAEPAAPQQEQTP